MSSGERGPRGLCACSCPSLDGDRKARQGGAAVVADGVVDVQDAPVPAKGQKRGSRSRLSTTGGRLPSPILATCLCEQEGLKAMTRLLLATAAPAAVVMGSRESLAYVPSTSRRSAASARSSIDTSSPLEQTATLQIGQRACCQTTN
jgi:hypothetical protein